MSAKSLCLVLIAAATVVAGCGKKEAAAPASPENSGAASSPTTPAAPPGTAANPAAAPAVAGAARTIELTANDAMKFNLTRIDAKAGETIKVVLRNVGNLPKAAMGHNFVLLKSGVNVDEFAATAITAGPAKDYFPTDKVDQTLGHTKLIGPRETAEVTITLPTAAGEYAFLCTFPGHFAAGMRGVVAVK